MGGRHRRALQNTRPIDFWHSILPSIVTALATSGASWWVIRSDKHAEMNTITVPLVVGLLTFVGWLLVSHGGEYLWRFTTGRARSGSRRTLAGLNLSRLRERLRLSRPEPETGSTTSIWADEQTGEVWEFADELKDLLSDSDWQVFEVGHGWPSGRWVKNIEIYVPALGNRGISELSKALNKWGYPCQVIESDGRSANDIDIVVGEPA